MLAKWIPFYGIYATEQRLAAGETAELSEPRDFACRITFLSIALMGIALAVLMYRHG